MESSTGIVSVGSAEPGLVRYGRRFATEFKTGLGHHLLLQLGGGAVFLSGYLASMISGYYLAVSPMEFAVKYVLIAGAIVFTAIALFKFARMVAIDRPDRPVAELLRWTRFDILSPARMANGIHGIGFVFLLMGGFTMWKNQVPRFGGFAWDEAFAKLDRSLHFGVYPHDLLQTLLGHPITTSLIDRNYVLWFPVLFAACFIVSFQPHRSLSRHRFLLALLLAWGFGGVILANLFASAGPVYFARVTGLADPYLAHFQYLAAADPVRGLKALGIQEKLWTNFGANNSVSFISAMPSMHCAVAVLVFLGCRALGRTLALITGAFATLIFIGSVHLGWHYAIDGYLGALIALLAWKVALPVSRWQLSRCRLQDI